MESSWRDRGPLPGYQWKGRGDREREREVYRRCRGIIGETSRHMTYDQIGTHLAYVHREREQISLNTQHTTPEDHHTVIVLSAMPLTLIHNEYKRTVEKCDLEWNLKLRKDVIVRRG